LRTEATWTSSVFVGPYQWASQTASRMWLRLNTVPGSLAESLDALEQDYDFLLKGDVFTTDVIETWISMKRSKDVAPVNLRPHPYEFFLYYDA